MAGIKSTPIAVIGAGSWGTALALLLARNDQDVRLWGHESDDMVSMKKNRVNQHYLPDFPFPENLSVALTLQDALKEVRDILIVVPSHAFRSVMQQLKPILAEDARLVWGTKGIDPESCQTLDVVAQEVLGEAIPLAVLSGPSFAVEVAADCPTAVTLASKNELFANDLIERFRNNRFRLYKSEDMKGVELCGVYKNVLAIGAGLCDGLSLGANARSALLTRGISELSRLITAAGGNKETIMGLAGIGDTILTCTTDQSRNRRFGLAVGSGVAVPEAVKQVGQVVEGFINSEQLHKLADLYDVDMPIVSVVFRVLHSGLAPAKAAEELLSRSSVAKWE